MNDVLKKVIDYKRKQHESMMWERIFYIGWGIRTLDYKVLRKELPEIYSEKDIERTKEFIVSKRKELGKVLTKFEKDNKLSGFYAVGDDGFWDLTAHIVGLGKERYDSVMKNPVIAREISLNNMYKENFEYSFNIERNENILQQKEQPSV